MLTYVKTIKRVFEDMIKDLKVRLPGWALNVIICAFIKESWMENTV